MQPTLEKVREILAQRIRDWRELQQPFQGTAKEIKERDVRERELRTQIARAAAHWLHIEEKTGGWRDIATAPKDGTHILACDARTPYGPQWTFNQRPPTVVHWWANPGEEGFYTSVNEMEPQATFPATHWKPLGSEPPSQTQDVACLSG